MHPRGLVHSWCIPRSGVTPSARHATSIRTPLILCCGRCAALLQELALLRGALSTPGQQQVPRPGITSPVRVSPSQPESVRVSPSRITSPCSRHVPWASSRCGALRVPVHYEAGPDRPRPDRPSAPRSVSGGRPPFMAVNPAVSSRPAAAGQQQWWPQQQQVRRPLASTGGEEPNCFSFSGAAAEAASGGVAMAIGKQAIGKQAIGKQAIGNRD